MIVSSTMKRWIFFVVYAIYAAEIGCLTSPWSYECQNGKCVKKETEQGKENEAIALQPCQLVCLKDNGLWPKPTGKLEISNILVPVDIKNIAINTRRDDSFLNKASSIFREELNRRIPTTRQDVGDGWALSINMYDKELCVEDFSLETPTDESYNITIEPKNKMIVVGISATNCYGSRHALETLGQLIVFDDLRLQSVIPLNANITDKPAFPYRGILLDTSRNYVDVNTIKKTINGMAASKLNTFHWHITDSHSFPYVSKSRPELSRYGSYSASKVYTAQDVAEIIDFARSRGVRVLPEFDAPAHVGEGWQKTGLVLCFDAQPWTAYCVEPPCGVFDVTRNELYDALEDIYGDMIEQFGPAIFHMGGDEVAFQCWNQTENVIDYMSKKGWGRTNDDFAKLWGEFQSRALERLHKKAGKAIPTIVWTSKLTELSYVTKYLPKDQYIIQIWTLGNDKHINELLNEGYKLILSNYDALYLDCGFSGWVTDGNNWCSPYIGWQKIYDNKPKKIAGSQRINQILGAEATLWTEQADSASIDTKLWPRAAAMAETLWSDPETGWREAESRFLIHRERLVAKGINADSIEPEWCLQNDGECPLRQ